MAYFPYSRFDFSADKNYYYPLSFDYDAEDKVNVVIANSKGQSVTLTYGADYTLEGDKINVFSPKTLSAKYSLTITKIFAIRFSGICVTPEFQYGVYLDVKKIQRTLEAMALQLAEVQMTSENSVKLAYEEWEDSNIDPVVQIPTVRERAGRIMAFDDDGKALMISDAELADTVKQYIKSAKEPVTVDASLLSYSFPGVGDEGIVNPEEYAKLESVFTVRQGDITFTAVEATEDAEYPEDKASFSLTTALTSINGIEVDGDTIRGTELTEMTADSAMIAVTVAYRDLEGYADKFIKIISLSKTKTGPGGKDGEDGHSYTIRIESTNGVVFRMGESVDTTLSIQVLRDTDDITDTMEDYRFKWIRKTGDEIEDERWNTSSKALYHKSVDITTEDCIGRTVFECEVDLEGL